MSPKLPSDATRRVWVMHVRSHYSTGLWNAFVRRTALGAQFFGRLQSRQELPDAKSSRPATRPDDGRVDCPVRPGPVTAPPGGLGVAAKTSPPTVAQTGRTIEG